MRSAEYTDLRNNILLAEEKQTEYECEEGYCLDDTDNDEVVSSTLSCWTF